MTAELFALFVAGLVASPFIQFVKERLKVSGPNALWLSWFLSLALALVALVATGELGVAFASGDPIAFSAQILEAFAAVFGLATVVYKAKFDQPGA